jgi:hypothetical protein
MLERTPSIHRWVGPRACLDVVKRKILAPAGNRTLVFQVTVNITVIIIINISETSGFYGGKYEDDSLLGYYVMYSHRS